MKYSRQKQLIEQTIKESYVHLTADDVYSILKQDNPNLSLGTVYRNLNKLVEKGIVRRLVLGNGGDRFDGNLEEHHHIVCEKCGAIMDICLKDFPTLDEKIKSETGAIPTSYQLVVRGICKDCQSF